MELPHNRKLRVSGRTLSRVVVACLVLAVLAIVAGVLLLLVSKIDDWSSIVGPLFGLAGTFLLFVTLIYQRAEQQQSAVQAQETLDSIWSQHCFDAVNVLLSRVTHRLDSLVISGRMGVEAIDIWSNHWQSYVAMFPASLAVPQETYRELMVTREVFTLLNTASELVVHPRLDSYLEVVLRREVGLQIREFISIHEKIAALSAFLNAKTKGLTEHQVKPLSHDDVLWMRDELNALDALGAMMIRFVREPRP